MSMVNLIGITESIFRQTWIKVVTVKFQNMCAVVIFTVKRPREETMSAGVRRDAVLFNAFAVEIDVYFIVASIVIVLIVFIGIVIIDFIDFLHLMGIDDVCMMAVLHAWSVILMLLIGRLTSDKTSY